MVIKKEEFIRKYVRALKEGNAAIFAGAGISIPSGFVNWKELLRPLAIEIGLDVDKEHDLLAVAQYYRNSKGIRTSISQEIMDAFSRRVAVNENIRILSRLPIHTYWTTNYDELLEQGIRDANRNPDVKSESDQLPIMRSLRDAIVYKMHGDVNHPANAVLTKSDYELYENKRPLFRIALKADLISKRFLFIGFSFEDPNIDYVLGKIHSLLEGDSPIHYWLHKKIQIEDYETQSEYEYAKTKQEMQIDNLKRYGINTVLVDSYDEMTEMLREIERAYKLTSVFISGSADSFDTPWDKNLAEQLSESIAGRLIHEDFRVTSGFGLGIGSAVVNGALKVIYNEKFGHIGDYLCLRPFPQNIDDPDKRALLYKKYRENILSETGVSIFLFGNKKSGSEIVDATGCIQEYEIAKENGNIIIPIGSTGYAAWKIYSDIKNNISNYKYLSRYIDQLGVETDIGKITDIIMKILKEQIKY